MVDWLSLKYAIHYAPMGCSKYQDGFQDGCHKLKISHCDNPGYILYSLCSVEG